MNEGQVIKIFPEDQSTCKTVLIIDSHVGVHPENLEYLKAVEAELDWYDEENYSTYYLSTGEYIEVDELQGINRLNNLIEIDYEVVQESFAK
tara:strand:- start:1030 stop:1305 length:276 start_codon:yes stop_codon:yes gene_type:complete